jgi:uncharacterized spore protein YtfJ
MLKRGAYVYRLGMGFRDGGGEGKDQRTGIVGGLVNYCVVSPALWV